MKTLSSFFAALFALLICFQAEAASPALVRYGTEKVEGLDIFYREAGDPSKPAIVLLHGFPSSSHMYREVLSSLGDEYYLIAPDYPGFGNSSFPALQDFTYTFDHIAEVMDAFLVQRGISKYALMIQDYGAPIGYRIATKHPERVLGFIVQNGNAYVEGIGEEGWGPVLKYWKTKTPELESDIIKGVFSMDAMKWQYTHGTRKPEGISPDNWNLDYMKISRPGQHAVQLALLYDYQNNLKLYPSWQQYFRDKQPPMLIVWGKNDMLFPEPGAAAYKNDVKNLEYHMLNTGHFALEEEAPFITDKIREFMERITKP